MQLQLYFDGYTIWPTLRKSGPARITVHTFENATLDFDKLVIDCEARDFSKSAMRWTTVAAKQRPLHLVEALEKLAEQRQRIKDALGIEHDNYVRVQLASGSIIELANWKACGLEFWCLNLRIDETAGRPRADAPMRLVTWKKMQAMTTFPYEAQLRQAIIKMLQVEMQVKEACGLDVTSTFAQLETALRTPKHPGLAVSWARAHEPAARFSPRLRIAASRLRQAVGGQPLKDVQGITAL